MLLGEFTDIVAGVRTRRRWLKRFKVQDLAVTYPSYGRWILIPYQLRLYTMLSLAEE
jgi:hypothetical protein